MKQHHKTLGSAIRARLQVSGLTQTGLAKRAHTDARYIYKMIHEISNPTATCLKRIGISVHKTYTLHDNYGGMPDVHAYIEKPVIDLTPPGAARQTASSVAGFAATGPISLTADLIKIAMAYGIAPGKHWASFVQSASHADLAHPAALERAWQSYCAAHAQVQAEPIKPVSRPPVTPELYGHLKPVNRGADYRRPLARGELPRPSQTVQPVAESVPGTLDKTD